MIGNRDAFGIPLDEIPFSETRIDVNGSAIGDEDDDSSRLALAIISVLFGLIVVAVLVAALYFIARKSGLISRIGDRSKSLPLNEMDEENNGGAPQSRETLERNEKAFSKLGLRMSYQRSRRII